MLTEKDYCDYETCVVLKELGFSEPTLAYYHGFLPSKPLLYLIIDEDCMPEDGVNVFDLLSNSNKYKDSKNIDAPTLWEVQKWLREEKGLFVNVELFGDYDRDADGKTLGTWVYYSYGILNTKTADFIREYDLCTEYQTYEEALSEGIKEAVKILKEDETIHE